VRLLKKLYRLVKRNTITRPQRYSSMEKAIQAHCNKIKKVF